MTPIDDFNPHLTDAEIEEFAKLYKEEFKIDLKPDEAQEMATRVMTLYNFIYIQRPPRSSTEAAIKNAFEPTSQPASQAEKKVRIPTHPSPRLDDIRETKKPTI
jgi:hypothetical protein